MPEDFDLSDNPFPIGNYGNPILAKEARDLYRKIRQFMQVELDTIHQQKKLSQQKILLDELLVFSKEEFTELYVERFGE